MFAVSPRKPVIPDQPSYRPMPGEAEVDSSGRGFMQTALIAVGAAQLPLPAPQAAADSAL